nr:hypothetical protein [Tanacetum cinerariifolium]
MFERENISGSNYNDWFCSPKMVLRVEKKLFVIKQPISLAPPADSKYMRSGIGFMMLIMRLLVLRLKEEGKPVGPYVIKMNNYVARLKRLGYVLPQDISVGLILNGLTSDFADFIRNYSKHNMGKMIGELHALLIEYEKDLPKKDATPHVMAIQEHPTKDDTCHHYKEAGRWKRNCPAYLAELIKKKKLVGTAISLDIFVIELYSFPSKSWVYDASCGTHICNTKHGLRRTLKALRSDRRDEYISQEFKDYLKDCGFVQQLTPPYTPQLSDDYALESAAHILNMVPTKKVDKTPYKLCGRAIEIQDEDTSPSENTSEIPIEEMRRLFLEQELIPVRRDVKRMQNVPYASVVGKPHWTVVKTILKNLGNTKDMFLVYGRNFEAKLRVDCYCNAGFETDRDDIKSLTGYVFVLNENAVH